jgi:hypothetical protein
MWFINAVVLFILTSKFVDQLGSSFRSKVLAISILAPLFSGLVALVLPTSTEEQFGRAVLVAWLLQIALIWLALVFWIKASRSEGTRVAASYFAYQVVVLVGGRMLG